MRIEAAIEADHQRGAGFPDHRKAFLDALHVEIDRLLAEDRLSGPGKALDQIRMRIGRRADDDGIDIRSLLDLVDGADFAAMRSGKILGGLFKASATATSFALGLDVTAFAWTLPIRPAPSRPKRTVISYPH